MIHTEQELAGLCHALIEQHNALSSAERALLKKRAPVSRQAVAQTRREIRQGLDPLGAIFCTIRTPEARRGQGATYTPPAIVDAMLTWASQESADPVRVVDPGAGSGRFILAAAKRFPKAQLIAAEMDPLAALMLRANACVQTLSDRLSVQVIDYRKLTLQPINGPTLFIGNPPYVRHHDIEPRWKAWFGNATHKLGFVASSLAGLHIHFFVRTRQLARPGDFGAFITAAEWMDVNYGSVLRQMLADGLGGTALHVIDPKAQPFTDALATGAITCFRVGRRPDNLTLRHVATLDELAPLSDGRSVPWSTVAAAPKWSHFVRETAPVNADEMELGELFRVHRGQVTGSNEIWVENPDAPPLPARLLLPAVTRARELLNAGSVLTDAAALRRVVDLPADLDQLSETEAAAVKRFLKWAKRAGADKSYVARHRPAWWSVNYRTPAPILCTYMARRPPHFVRNAAGARHLNIAHGLYPRQELSTEVLDQVISLLNGRITGDGGRVYAGGLIKFEPRELERIRIPRLEISHAVKLPPSMDSQAIPGRRGPGDGRLSSRTAG